MDTPGRQGSDPVSRQAEGMAPKEFACRYMQGTLWEREESRVAG